MIFILQDLYIFTSYDLCLITLSSNHSIKFCISSFSRFFKYFFRLGEHKCLFLYSSIVKPSLVAPPGSKSKPNSQLQFEQISPEGLKFFYNLLHKELRLTCHTHKPGKYIFCFPYKLLLVI